MMFQNLSKDIAMKLSKLCLLGIASVLLASCATAPSMPGAPSYKDRLTSDGLTPLTGAEIETMFRGNSFKTPDGAWTWEFGEDGLAQANARDGSWQTKDQRWSVEGDTLCRSIKEAYPCVSIYEADGVIRFGKAKSANLETWAIVSR